MVHTKKNKNYNYKISIWKNNDLIDMFFTKDKKHPTHNTYLVFVNTY